MIYVIGCNHGIQREQGADTQEMKEQQSHFGRLIEEIIASGKVELVCEEWDENGGVTIARELTMKHGARWVNINTSAADLKKMGIPPFYTKPPYAAKLKAPGHAKRECFMLRKINENRGSAENVLVVCGFDHMDRLSNQLRVTPRDYRRLGWRKAGVFSANP